MVEIGSSTGRWNVECWRPHRTSLLFLLFVKYLVIAVYYGNAPCTFLATAAVGLLSTITTYWMLNNFEWLLHALTVVELHSWSIVLSRPIHALHCCMCRKAIKARQSLILKCQKAGSGKTNGKWISTALSTNTVGIYHLHAWEIHTILFHIRNEMKWKVQWFKVRSKTDSEPA